MEFRPALFWDVDSRKIDPRKNARYVIERILELGQPNDIAWMFKQYSKDEIKKVISLPRSQVGPKSKALWTLILK